MNILLVTAMFPPIRTGSSHYSRDIAQALTKRGHHVVVVTLKDKEGNSDSYDFPVYRLPAVHFQIKNYFNHFRVSSFFPSNYIRMINIAKEHRIEKIWLVNHYLDIAFLAVVASRFLKLPLVCSVHTQLQSIFPWRDKILNIFDRLICGKLIFAFCSKIISADKQIEMYINDVHGPSVVKKSVIIAYGVSGHLKSFLDHNHDYTLHNRLLSVGAIIEQRNYLVVVGVFAKLLKIFPALRLKVIGHNYYDAAIRLAEKMGVSDKVEFVGELPHEKVLEELKQTDIYFGIATGKYNGLGTACIEAMLTGVPTVANVDTDVFGQPPVLFDMDNCIIARLDDVEDTAQRVAYVLEDRKLREKIGRNGRRFVKEDLSWEKIGGQMEQTLQTIVQKGKGKEGTFL
jgi:glycosyltransferase involved in cell wall biosynthesis